MRRTNRLADIILLESIQGLGGPGKSVKVKSGYFRNFLLPQNKALLKTEENSIEFEKKKNNFLLLDASRQKEAEEIAERLRIVEIKIVRAVTPEGTLYGSVGLYDILTELHNNGFTKILRQNIRLSKAFKELGTHEINIYLHPKVSQSINITIEPQFYIGTAK